MYSFPFSFWQTSESISLKGNLLAYYNFNTFNTNSGAVDIINRFDLSPTNTIQLISPGKVPIHSKPARTDFSFFCTGSNFFSTNNSAFNIQGDKTFAFWLNWLGNFPDTFIIAQIITKDLLGANSSGGYHFSLDAGGAVAFVTNTSGGVPVSASATIQSGSWNFVIGWTDYKNRQVSIATGFSPVSSGAWISTDGPSGNSLPFCIGSPLPALTYGEGNFLIDEVSIWNRKLNIDEMKYLYNNGSGRTYPFNFN
jgi:hypothetical protein